MSTQHVAWGSIELLHNVVRTLTHLHSLGAPLPVIEYRAKVKLHGANCAVQITDDGVVAQSRTQLLTPEADYKGFAAWLRAHEAYFAALARGTVVFGEWCGPGVEKGMAISQASAKVFAVFALQLRAPDGERVIGERVIVEPDEIRARLPAAGAPDTLFVLPWHGAPVAIDFADRGSLDAATAPLNQRVAEVEREDPWVKHTFGISGLGEGLVFYPVRIDGGPPPSAPEPLAQRMFKAKGDKHRTAATKAAVQVDASVVASVDDFVALMVTEARLAQAVAAVGGREPRLTGAFLSWLTADVRKESLAELEASGLTWSQVEKAVQVRARGWFAAK
jgi:hypothetical protein